MRILQAVRIREIIIDPYDRKNLGSNSYDLHLGNTLLIYDTNLLDAKKSNPTKLLHIDEKDGILLSPGELYLGVTQEIVYQDDKYVPAVEGKSSIGRLGIFVHITAGFGDVGFHGRWTLEIVVVKPIIIYAGMPICQIFWVAADGKCEKPYWAKESAKYVDKDNPLPVPSAMWRNFQKS